MEEKNAKDMDERKLELASLTEAVEVVKEILEQFNLESDEDNMADNRAMLESSLLELSGSRGKSLENAFYAADEILDKAEKAFTTLHLAIQSSLDCFPFYEPVIAQHASELRSWLQDACGDIAHGTVQGGIHNMYQDIKTRFAQAKKDGVKDLAGWYADEIYNSADDIRDILGDRIHDAAKGDRDMMVAIAIKIKDGAHAPLIAAMDKFIADHPKV